MRAKGVLWLSHILISELKILEFLKLVMCSWYVGWCELSFGKKYKHISFAVYTLFFFGWLVLGGELRKYFLC